MGHAHSADGCLHRRFLVTSTGMDERLRLISRLGREAPLRGMAFLHSPPCRRLLPDCFSGLSWSIIRFPQFDFVPFNIQDVDKLPVLRCFNGICNGNPLVLQFFNKRFQMFHPVVYHEVLC